MACLPDSQAALDSGGFQYSGIRLDLSEIDWLSAMQVLLTGRSGKKIKKSSTKNIEKHTQHHRISVEDVSCTYDFGLVDLQSLKFRGLHSEHTENRRQIVYAKTVVFVKYKYWKVGEAAFNKKYRSNKKSTPRILVGVSGKI